MLVCRSVGATKCGWGMGSIYERAHNNRTRRTRTAYNSAAGRHTACCEHTRNNGHPAVSCIPSSRPETVGRVGGAPYTYNNFTGCPRRRLTSLRRHRWCACVNCNALRPARVHATARTHTLVRARARSYPLHTTRASHTFTIRAMYVQ